MKHLIKHKTFACTGHVNMRLWVLAANAEEPPTKRPRSHQGSKEQIKNQNHVSSQVAGVHRRRNTPNYLEGMDFHKTAYDSRFKYVRKFHD
jgi:hypothetical protein